MNRICVPLLILTLNLFCSSAFAQTDTTATADTTLLGLPGDNLDLYVVLDLFQKSKTIEDFEKSLNDEKSKINNLDLDLDGKVDFIKVVTKQEDDDFTFILQVDVSKTEKQDVAVILLTKDKDKKITMQIVGDPELYGKDYIVELKESKTPPVTPNPGYTGPDTVKVVAAPATTTTVVVQSAPIVQYVYSPVYVPYYPPYYYGFYPPYFTAAAVISIGIYRSNHYYYHGGGYPYHGNTVVVHNHNTYNNYNNYNRNTSNTVNHNKASGNYNRGNNASTRPANGGAGGARPSTQPSRPSTGNQGGARPSTQPSTRPSTGNQGGTRPSTQPSTRPSTGNQGGARPSTQPSTRPSNNYSGSSSRPSSSYSGASRPSSQPSSRPSSSYSGGGRSMGGGGYSGGGASRGGGGGGGRRR